MIVNRIGVDKPHTTRPSLIGIGACTIVQAYGYGNKLDLTFNNRPLNYPLFINNFQQRQQMINDPAVELDLLISSSNGQARKSIEWCALYVDPTLGLDEALAILKN